MPSSSPNELPEITLDDNSKISPKLVVGSDGENSMTRNQYGIGTQGWSYGQNGLVCSVSTLQPNTIAF